MKFIFNTENYKLVMKKTEGKEKKLKWNLSGFCDSDYAGDTDTRQSISGYIIYVNNCPMSWRS